jgi:5-(carboxyamino)imidazole ribonucleotide synthase
LTLSKYVVGVIGGGQLARMMVPPAVALDIELRVLAEADNSPAQIAATQVGDFHDLDTVLAFAKGVDVVSFDHEHVPLEILRSLEQAGISVQPSSHALSHAQNKLVMRRALEKLGAPNPKWKAVSSSEELDTFIEQLGGVCIVKTPIGGYDGKGVRVVRNSSEVSDWLADEMLQSLGGELLVEEKVDFETELAQLSARNPSGDFLAWPLVETRQLNGVCSEVLSPSPGASKEIRSQTEALAKKIAEGLGVTGVLAVELFQTKSGQILVNELAMRPHNSGHFTIEGSATSQFEQHLRATLDLPLGSVEERGKYSVMVNILGVSDSLDFTDNYQEVMESYPEAKIHSYGKSARIGRKLGHITVVSDNQEHALATARGAHKLLLRVK